MKIHFLKEDALTALKANVQANLTNYKKPTNEWIYDYFQGENPFLEANFECDDFQLYTSDSADELAQIEIQNVRILYSALINLSDTQASDERLWAGLCHSDLWDYMHKRWNMKEANDATMKAVPSRYFFSSGRKRSLFVNTPSKLWWVGRIIYDSRRSDPFELLKYFSDSFSVKVLPLFSNNFMGNRELTAGLIEALIYLDSIGYELKEMKEGWQTISKGSLVKAASFLNVYGGTHILDYYTKEEIRDKVIEYMMTLPHLGKSPETANAPVIEKSKQTIIHPTSIQTIVVATNASLIASNIPKDDMDTDDTEKEIPSVHQSQQTGFSTLQTHKELDSSGLEAGSAKANSQVSFDDIFHETGAALPSSDRMLSQTDEKLIAYCEDMRMSCSYKAVLLLALLEYVEDDGKMPIEKAVPYFRKFYRSRIEKGLPAELKSSIYSDLDVDDGRILSNIIRNPLNALLLSNFFEFDSISQRFGFKPDVWIDISSLGRKKMEEATKARLSRYYKDMPT